MKQILVLILSAVLAMPAGADPASSPIGGAQKSAQLPADAPINNWDFVVLGNGQPAPGGGVLLREEAFKRVVLQQAQLTEARAQVKARDEALAKALPLVERSPLERWGFWVGLGLGVVGGAAIGALVAQHVKK